MSQPLSFAFLNRRPQRPVDQAAGGADEQLGTVQSSAVSQDAFDLECLHPCGKFLLSDHRLSDLL